MRVEIVERLVLVAQELLELSARVAGSKALVGVFVADLPADDVWIVAVAAGELGDDVGAELAVQRAGVVELAAAAMFGAHSVFIDAKGLWVLRREPRGRRIGGRADHDCDVVLRGECDGAVQPAEIVVAFGGFHGGPGELADAHDVEVGLLHQGEVGVPARFGPLLGIPG